MGVRCWSNIIKCYSWWNKCNKNSGSTNPNTLISAIKKTKADLGIALDGDADRCVLVDDKGRIVNGDLILAIIATKWKNKNILKKNTVVGTKMTNSGLANYLEKNNINFIRTDVGDKNIIKEMRQNDFVLGGEPLGIIPSNMFFWRRSFSILRGFIYFKRK